MVTPEERDDMIYETVRKCGGCGSREFPRRSDCESCIAAVDEWIASQTSAEADRIAAITREIATT
jgi:uncharacterized OB-fold protein